MPGLLAVALQHRPARDRELRPIGLEAGEDHEFVLARHAAAMPHHVPAAGILLLLGPGIGESRDGRHGNGRGQHEGTNHRVLPGGSMNRTRALGR